MNLLFVLASEEHHENGFFFPGDLKEFYWGGAAFLIVAGLLAWKVLPIAKTALQKRSDTIADQLATAETAQAEADAEAEALLAKLGDADADAEAIVADARVAAERLEADSATKATADAEELKSRATAEIAAASTQATAELRGDLSRQARSAAEAVVAENLDDAAQSDLIEQFIAQLGVSS